MWDSCSGQCQTANKAVRAGGNAAEQTCPQAAVRSRTASSCLHNELSGDLSYSPEPPVRGILLTDRFLVPHYSAPSSPPGLPSIFRRRPPPLILSPLERDCFSSSRRHPRRRRGGRRRSCLRLLFLLWRFFTGQSGQFFHIFLFALNNAVLRFGSTINLTCSVAVTPHQCK